MGHFDKSRHVPSAVLLFERVAAWHVKCWLIRPLKRGVKAKPRIRRTPNLRHKFEYVLIPQDTSNLAPPR